MRWCVFLTVASLALAGCGGGESSAESGTANAALFDEASIDAVLGGNVPADDISAGVADEGNADANTANLTGNAAD